MLGELSLISSEEMPLGCYQVYKTLAVLGEGVHTLARDQLTLLLDREGLAGDFIAMGLLRVESRKGTALAFEIHPQELAEITQRLQDLV
ncbi:MAG: hypothetical protein Q7S31_01435 [bacterium]|nr:hypothetical protein [bacterium]